MRSKPAHASHDAVFSSSVHETVLNVFLEEQLTPDF
jgi:hypothetical protein